MWLETNTPFAPGYLQTPEYVCPADDENRDVDAYLIESCRLCVCVCLFIGIRVHVRIRLFMLRPCVK